MSSTSKQPIIRPATTEDAASIASIGRETFNLSFGHSMSGEDMQAYLDLTYTPEAIALEIGDTRNTFLVACQPEVIGFVQLKKGTTEACLPLDTPVTELHRIYMHHESNGRGVGRLLMEAAHTIAKNEHYSGIWLGVWEENVKAQKFYEKLGYERIGHHDFVIGNEIQRDWVLLKIF